METLSKVDANDFFKVVGIFSSVALGNILLYKGIKKAFKDNLTPSNSKENIKDESEKTNCFLENGEKVVHDATLLGVGVGIVAAVYNSYTKGGVKIENWYE